MTIELNLLKALSIKENLEKYTKLLNPKTLSLQTVELLKQYQEYFKVYITDTEVSFSKFTEFFFIIRHPTMDERQASNYKQIIDEVSSVDIEDRHVLDIIKAFETQEFYAVLHQDLDRNVNIGQLQTKIQEYGQKMALLGESDVLKDDSWNFERIAKVLDRTGGLQWRLNSLNEHFGGGVQLGDLIIFAGYSDSGKTSFTASEVSFMAEQLEGEDRVMWFNTEGTSDQVRGRLSCAAMNCTSNDLTKNPEGARLKYSKLMKGDIERIQVIDAHVLDTRHIEKMLIETQPKLIVFDLLDDIQGFNQYLGKEGNTVERISALYQWARVIASTIAPVFVISQTNGEGNDNMYPAMTALKNSRVGKQAAATTMLFIGSQQGNDNERYISTPKNKIGGGKGFRKKVNFDPLRSRFSD